MVTRIIDSKALKKDILWDSKCKFDGRKINSNQKRNKELRRCEWKNSAKHCVCKKDYVWNPTICAGRMANI